MSTGGGPGVPKKIPHVRNVPGEGGSHLSPEGVLVSPLTPVSLPPR